MGFGGIGRLQVDQAPLTITSATDTLHAFAVRSVQHLVEGPMSNKAIMREWFDKVWNQRDATAAEGMLAPDYRSHGLGANGGDLTGPGGFKSYHASFIGAMADLHITIEDLVEEGDLVVARWTLRGTLTGDTFGVPATGRPATVAGMSMARFANGKVIESWNAFDLLNMHRQLGTLQHVAM